ncbi:MAG: hypothetical protein QM813_21425 [Verrucomicrobiota bacterium]
MLYGSANPIGGQNQIIKLRDGASPEGMVRGRTVRFALGGVKQSNSRRVFHILPTFYRNRFTAAQQYLKEWSDFKECVFRHGAIWS